MRTVRTQSHPAQAIKVCNKNVLILISNHENIEGHGLEILNMNGTNSHRALAIEVSDKISRS